MKKILFSMLTLGASILTSCDMDLSPIGSINNTDAIESVNDVMYFRNGLYSNMRALSTGAYVFYTELQMDEFLGLTINGNFYSAFNNGTVLSSNGDIESIWAGLYGAIGNCNFLIPRAEALLERENIKEADRVAIKRYVGEAYFARAYYYAYLLDHFCPVMTSANAETPDLGLPLVSEYEPTADRSKYPGRATLAATYAFVEADLQRAYDDILAFETADPATAESETLAVGAMYVGTPTIKAMMARVALWKGDYTNAAKYADEVIKTTNCTITPRNQYGRLWTSDTGSELLFVPFSSATELGISATGQGWNDVEETRGKYIPTEYVTTDLYPKGDIRYTIFVGARSYNVEGDLYDANSFDKYPGNPDLIQQGQPNQLYNKAKPFRLSEMYLIRAEASSQLHQEEQANADLTEIRKNRITNYTAVTYQGNDLTEQIRLERNRELIGEGFRMSDLRRWKVEWTRSGKFEYNPDIESIIVRTSDGVHYSAEDYRYVWPIPSSEMQVNPQMRQNPGYAN